MTTSNIEALLPAVRRYFDLMHESDVTQFERVFRPSAQLHGYRLGSLRLLTAQDYKSLLASTPSPKSKNAPREEEILLVDFASSTQALVKVRVRIDAIVYVDYLAYHFIDGAWLITAKSFHGEQAA